MFRGAGARAQGKAPPAVDADDPKAVRRRDEKYAQLNKAIADERAKSKKLRAELKKAGDPEETQALREENARLKEALSETEKRFAELAKQQGGS